MAFRIESCRDAVAEHDDRNRLFMTAGGSRVEMLDYQGYLNGGHGWLQILRFVPDEKRIHVEAHCCFTSPRR